MGSRANYLHVRPDGTHRLLYSHWGGQRVDTDLFGGPAALIRLLDSLRDDVGWLDDRWAEGGVVIDERRRELKWFGGELVPISRKVGRPDGGAGWTSASSGSTWSSSSLHV